VAKKKREEPPCPATPTRQPNRARARSNVTRRHHFRLPQPVLCCTTELP
jgi:hypothetical protein